eukprot:13046-Heterococcus_DN1.PRE.1
MQPFYVIHWTITAYTVSFVTTVLARLLALMTYLKPKRGCATRSYYAEHLLAPTVSKCAATHLSHLLAHDTKSSMDSTDTLLTATKSVMPITEASNDGLHVKDTASCNAAHRQHRSAVVARLLLSIVAVPLWTSLHQHGAGAIKAIAGQAHCQHLYVRGSTARSRAIQTLVWQQSQDVTQLCRCDHCCVYELKTVRIANQHASMLTCSCTTAVASNSHQHSATTGKRCSSSTVATEEYMFVSISSCLAHLAPA